MTPGSDIVEIREARDPAQVGDTPGMHDRRAVVVDGLLLDERPAIQMVLKTSPTASGVVVCWRMSLKDSGLSAATVSSSQKSRYGSRSLPSRAASIGVSR